MVESLKMVDWGEAEAGHESGVECVSEPLADDDRILGWLARHEWLVFRQASRYFHRTPGCRDDLLQECRIALLRARKMYDGNRKVPFAAYASRVLSRAAQKFVITETRCGFGGQILCRPYDAPRIATAAPDSGGSTPLIELIADDYRPPLHWTENQWAKVFRCLTATQQEVVRLRVFKRLTNREVGELLGFRESRASFLWQQALQRLRENRHAVEHP